MAIEKQKIIITGGAGFIGSHVALALAAKNTVTVLDNFASAVRTEDELRAAGIRVIRVDILDQHVLTTALAHQDMVFHFATACVRLSLNNPEHVHQVNATGALNLFLACKKQKIKRIIAISSSEIYGSAQTPLIKETHPAQPTTVYGMSKYMQELYGQLFFQQDELPIIIIRPFNTYGPFSHFDGVYGEVIPRFVIQALNGIQPTIFGTGAQTRDFTYISDTVNGILLAAQSEELIGQTINIARGEEITIRTIAETICDIVGLPFQPPSLAPRPHDVMRHAADIAKAKKRLHFTPAVGIADGLKKYITWITKTHTDIKKLKAYIPTTNW